MTARYADTRCGPEAQRSGIDRIIKEYTADAMAELGTSGSEFLAIDHAWVADAGLT